MSFKINKYILIKNALSKEMCNFLYGYFYFKRNVFIKYLKDRFISPYQTDWGNFGGGPPKTSYVDSPSGEVYSHYSDLAMETLLEKMRPLMEKQTGLKLYPTYSFARIYKKGDVLRRHIDRYACEISSSLCLGGDKWPIYIDSSKTPKGKKKVTINMEQGDMVIYRGCELPHWRTKFKKKECCQVFLHYIEKGSQKAEENKYDRRDCLGVSSFLRKGSKYHVG
jgi:hypothetical protein|tara:strand:+ start:1109 stop:1777 length:669 start_codon:yes stop_codon:yes gene_type:complete